MPYVVDFGAVLSEAKKLAKRHFPDVKDWTVEIRSWADCTFEFALIHTGKPRIDIKINYVHIRGIDETHWEHIIKWC
jgi:hypothetical protein